MNLTHAAPPTPPMPAYSERSIRVAFGGDFLDIHELSVAQVIALSAYTDEIASLDFSDVPALFAKHQAQMVNLLQIALDVPEQRILAARASQLTEALAAVIELNKAFFLQAVQAVVQAALLKATVQAQIQAAVQKASQAVRAKQPAQTTAPSSGQTASPASSPLATESEISSPTVGANTSPTSPPLSATPKPAPESSS